MLYTCMTVESALDCSIVEAILCSTGLILVSMMYCLSLLVFTRISFYQCSEAWSCSIIYNLTQAFNVHYPVHYLQVLTNMDTLFGSLIYITLEKIAICQLYSWNTLTKKSYFVKD